MSIAASHDPSLQYGASEPVGLDPATRHFLHEFRQRRLALLFYRGLSCVAILFAGMLLAAAVVDALFVGAAVRGLASLTFYATVCLSAVWLCWKPWQATANWPQEARRIEQLEPAFKEQLLSAVELASDSSSTAVDSSAFRQLLQLRVARRTNGIDVRLLLPWTRIQHWVRWGIVAVAMLCLVSIIPALHLPQRIGRILFPWADLGRVGRIAIAIERPLPQSRLVPREEIVAIRARADGPPPKRLTLETRTSEQTISSLEMTPWIADDRVAKARCRFEALVPARSQWTEYRVVGDGAQTPWYRLTTKARPTAIEFTKRITLPSYAQSEPFELVEEHGDIEVIAGSSVQLRITVDQPTSLAELRWETNATSAEVAIPTSVPLTFDPLSMQVSRAFVASCDADYKVFLQSAESGFVNAFSPSYRVKLIEDKPPTLTWMVPKSASLITSANQMVSLQCGISDEFPLAKITRCVRVNSSDWQTSDPVPEAFVDAQSNHVWDLDLLQHAVKSGDHVDIKLIATDRKGQASESSLVQIELSSTSLALDADTAESLRSAVAAKLQQLAETVKNARQDNERLAESINDEPLHGDSLDAIQAQQHAAEVASELHAVAAETLELLTSAIAQIDTPVSVQELMRVGEVLAAFQTEGIQQLRGAAEQTTPSIGEPNVTPPSAQERVLASLQYLEQTSEELSSRFRTLSTFDSVSRHVQQIAKLAEAQQQLATASDNPLESVESLARQQRILTLQLKDVLQSMQDSLPNVRAASRKPLQQSVDRLGQQIDFSQRLSEFSNREALAKMAHTLAFSLAEEQRLSRLDDDLMRSVQQAHQRLSELAPTVARPLRELADAVSSDNVVPSQATNISQQFSVRRALARASQYGDRQYASDLGSAQRGVEEIASSASLPTVKKATAIREIAQSLTTLEAIGSMAELESSLSTLLKSERWSNDAAELGTSGPRNWSAIQSSVPQVVRQLRAANLPADIVERLARLRSEPAALRAEQKIASRAWQNTKPLSAAAEVEDLTIRLSEIRTLLEPYARAARAQIAGYSPAISQLAERASQQTRLLEQQTEGLSKALTNQEVPSLVARLDQLKSDAARLSQPLQSLREALIDQADAQNLLDRQETRLAQQADAAIRLIDQVEKKVEESLLPVQSTGTASEQAHQLNRAADQQSLSALALEELAKTLAEAEEQHLNGLDETQLASRLADIQQWTMQLAENQEGEALGSMQANDGAYQQAQRLAQMAEQSPQQAIAQLEQELRSSPPMQAEMSSIAQQAAQQALDGLERAARDQRAIGPDLEISDPNARFQKELWLHDLVSGRESAARILDTLVSEVRWTAGAAKSESQEKSLVGLEQHLRNTVAATPSLELRSSLEEFMSATDELAAGLQAAEELLRTSAQEMTKSSFEEIHQNGADLNNRRREMLDRQRRIQQQVVRDAQAVERNQQQRLQQAEKELRQTELHQQSLTKKLQDSRQQLARNSDQGLLRSRISELEQQLTLISDSVTAQTALREALARRTAAAKSAVEKFNQYELRSLPSVNPSAELSSVLAKLAADEISNLEHKLAKWQAAKIVEAQASSPQLQQSQASESQVKGTVENASHDLARAARHEARLERVPSSQQLAELAGGAERVAAGEVGDVLSQLDTAHRDALSQGAASAQASSVATSAATRAILRAEGAILDSAKAVKELLAGQPSLSTQSPTPAGASESLAPEPAASMLNPQQKARLLDELDRQMNKDLQLGAKEDNSQPAPSGGSSSDQPTPGTLADAAKKLASSMSQARQPLPTPSTDAGQATDSQWANVDPQAPVAVRIIDVERIDGQWGKLRQQSTDALLQTQRDTISPRYRQQVEAYFRELAERGQDLK